VLSKKITINTVDLPGGGIIGMTHCPGRRGIDGDGQNWQRDLEQDLGELRAWGAASIVTLLEAGELNGLGVAALGKRVTAHAMRWYHWPVADMQAPGRAFFKIFNRTANALDDQLCAGDRIVLHCAAGLGRTGTVAASLLIRSGLTPEAAISQVRLARPGAIETTAQERFVRQAEILKRQMQYK